MKVLFYCFLFLSLIFISCDKKGSDTSSPNETKKCSIYHTGEFNVQNTNSETIIAVVRTYGSGGGSVKEVEIDAFSTKTITMKTGDYMLSAKFKSTGVSFSLSAFITVSECASGKTYNF